MTNETIEISSTVVDSSSRQDCLWPRNCAICGHIEHEQVESQKMADDRSKTGLTIAEAAREANVKRNVIDYAVKTGQIDVDTDSTGAKRISRSNLRIFLQSKYNTSALLSDGDSYNEVPSAPATGSTGSETSPKTVQALRQQITVLKQQTEEQANYISELEQRLEDERQRSDEHIRRLTEELMEANRYASVSQSGGSITEFARKRADSTSGSEASSNAS